ncbi:MAG: peptide deformylase [Acetatifactor sp.]|nr:peptide deformylase [Acetatifactor sp.]
MALRNIREMGDPILNKVCKEVKEITPRIKDLVEDMFETMYDAQGVGLAAPQVGILKRIAVVDVTGEDPLIFINPVILESDGEQEGSEGCLSIPGKAGIVIRPYHVKVGAYDINMNYFELEAEEFLARAICHEFDHLDGHLYVEKMTGELQDVTDTEEEAE